MADQVMTGSSQLANAIPEMWSASFYPALLEALPFNEVVSRDYEGDIKSLGDIVNISQFPQFAEASLISEDQKNDADAITVANTQLTINDLYAKDYIVTMVAQAQALQHAQELRKLALHSIMKRMQSELITDTVPSASAPDHQIAFDSGTTLALADILEAKELLDEQDVPDDGMRCMILGSEQWNDLFNISGFTSRDFVPAGSPVASGSFSTPLLGFRAKLTSEAADVSYLFHPSYMALAVQKSPEARVYDLGLEGKRAERVNFTALAGNVQLDNTRVVELS